MSDGRTPRLRTGRRWPDVVAASAVATVALAGCHTPQRTDGGPAPEAVASQVTFTDHVRPILEAHCQVCHQSEGIGPMSLVGYEETRAWAPEVRRRVRDRTMPPWHIDPTVGIQAFRNDRSLSEREIATILAWVDQGAPEGTTRDVRGPASGASSERGWSLQVQLGAPDLVIESDPHAVPARGQDQWWYPSVSSGLEQPQWLRAIEIRPVGRLGAKVTHHVVLYVIDGDGVTTLLAEWAPGKQGEVMPERTSRLIPAASSIRWDIHYVPMDVAAPEAQVEVGFWFHPEGYEPAFRSRLESFRADAQVHAARGSQIDIPPGEMRMVRTVHRLTSAARLESFQPHMHLRGSAMSLEALYPDGRAEVLSRVVRFDPRWQSNYLFAEAAMPLLPEGTDLVVTAWHDNTTANPNNPDPRQWVGFGRRLVDEMAHAWVGLSYLDPDVYQARAQVRDGTGPQPD